METVFETITRLIKEKKDNHVAPVSLTFNEIRKARDKLNGLIKENEALAEQIKNLQSELKHINSPLNKLFAWICKITKK